jgi:hypothetical protein
MLSLMREDIDEYHKQSRGGSNNLESEIGQYRTTTTEVKLYEVMRILTSN